MQENAEPSARAASHAGPFAPSAFAESMQPASQSVNPFAVQLPSQLPAANGSFGADVPEQARRNTSATRMRAHPRTGTVRSVSKHPRYDDLAAAFLRIYRFEHLNALAMWDHSTY